MSDSPRNRMHRHPNRLHRPHAGQSLDPTLTRKGVFAHPGSLLIGFGALFFFAYVFNLGGLQAGLDGLFSGLDTSARSHNGQVAKWFVAALPYLGVALGALVLFLALSALGRGAKRATRYRRLRKRDPVSLHDFEEAAAQHNVSKRIAREAYHLLLPHYDHKMRVTLSDRMTVTLRMKPSEISDLYGTLLMQTDRLRTVGDTGSPIDTVLDLLVAAERTTARSLSQSKIHEREMKTPARKRPSLGQKIKASLMRSMVRKQTPVVEVASRPKDPSMIKPYRPEKKEAEKQAKDSLIKFPVSRRIKLRCGCGGAYETADLGGGVWI